MSYVSDVVFFKGVNLLNSGGKSSNDDDEEMMNCRLETKCQVGPQQLYLGLCSPL